MPFARMKYYYCLDLKDSQELIAEYIHWHKPGNIWKEIPEGIRKTGISSLEIFVWNNRLVMTIDIDDSLDYNTCMQMLERMPRQAEWEEFMDKYQQRLEGAEPGSKWQRMENIFSLSDC